MSTYKRSGFGKSALFVAVASATLLTACSDSETTSTGGGTDPGGGGGTEPTGALTVNAAYSLMPTGLKQPITVTLSDGTVVNADGVTWTLDDGTDINAGDTDPFTWSATEGVLLADTASNAPGSYTLTASAGGESGSFAVEVVNAQLTDSLDIISPVETVMPVGFTVQYRALATFMDGTALIGSFDVTDVATWDSDNTEILLPDPNIKGLMRAEDESKTGVTASASYIASVGSEGSEYAQYNSVGGYGEPITTELITSVNGIDVTQLDANDSYVVGEQVQLVAKLGYNSGVGVEGSSWDVTREATWSSTAEDLIAVDETGMVSVLSTIDNPVDITAALEKDGKEVEPGKVKIRPDEVVEATVPPTIELTTTDGGNSVNLFTGNSTALKATATYDDKTSLNVTDDVVWSSSDSTVAVVNSKTGQVNAVADGTASITAVYQPDPELVIYPIDVAVATMDLSDLKVTGISSDSPQNGVIEVERGDAVYLKASGTPLVGGSERNVTSLVEWKENFTGPSVTITNYGKDAVEVAVGKNTAIGPFKVTASSETTDAADNITINVVERTPAFVLEELTISETGISFPATQSITVVPGEAVNLKAEGKVQDGGTHDVTKLVTWSEDSDNASITSHGADGGVLTVDRNATPGSKFFVDAVAQGVSATDRIQVKVEQAPATDILDMSDLEIGYEVATTAVGDIQIEQGESIQLKAAGTLLSGGSQEDVTDLVKWSTSPLGESPATISSYGSDGGILTVKRNATPGDTFTVTAEAQRAGETSNTLNFVVAEKPEVLDLSDLTIAPTVDGDTIEVEQGGTVSFTAEGTLLASDTDARDVTGLVKWEADSAGTKSFTITSYGDDAGVLYVDNTTKVGKVITISAGARVADQSPTDTLSVTVVPASSSSLALDSIVATDQIKTFDFNWSDSAALGTYEVCRFDAIQQNDCDSLASGIAGKTAKVEVPSLLNNDQYFVRNEMTGSTTDMVTPSSDQLLAVVGLVKAETPAVNGNFGQSVDFATLDDDTEIMAVGAHLTNSEETTNTETDGAVYLYQKTDGVWSFLQEVRPVEYFVDVPGKLGERFGMSLDLTSDGKTLVIGAPGDFGTDPAVYVFRKKDNQKKWAQELRYGQKVRDYTSAGEGTVRHQDDDVTQGSLLGQSVSVSDDGTTIAAGAAQWNAQGAVWMLQTDETGKYERVSHLNDEGNGWFGLRVLLSADGGSLLVSDTKHGDNYAGAVYYFDARQEEGTIDWSSFGNDATTAPEEASASIQGEVYRGQFGWTLSLSSDGKTLAISEKHNDENKAGVGGVSGTCEEDGVCAQSGAVYVYQKSMDEWSLQAQIKAEKVFPITEFGEGMVLSPDGNRLYVGVRGDDNNKTGIGGVELLEDHPGHIEDQPTKSDYGSLYTYVRKNGQWEFDRYVQVPVGYSASMFGKSSMAISPTGTVAVPLLDNSSRSGAGTLGAGIDDNSITDTGSVLLF